MMKIIYVFLFLVLGLFGIVFAVLNAAPVELHYYFGSKQVELSLVIVLSMMVGAVLGVIASTSVIVNSRREVHKLRKSMDLAEKEINNLRAIPLRDKH
ncbi:MAG: LapA family protein [Proteobacteria bacterium]|jgi:putative membrane protein|nr:LapA family protein [Pseudomonadota bacterium]MCG6934366.1 LapA family protein [Pseudomonadota bacterium]